MAKFIYKMQSVLNIKYKLEDQAKTHYIEVQNKYNEASRQLDILVDRKESFLNELRLLTSSKLDILKINSCKNSIDILNDKIKMKITEIELIEKQLDAARQKLNEVMKERKIHEKLREKAFDEFLVELNEQEKKEIDELVSYQYNKPQESGED